MDMINLECDRKLGVKDVRDSWENIYSSYSKKIYNYIRVNVKSTQDAEDLTGIVFEHVVKKGESYSSDKGSFEAWLFTIAHHVLVDHCRRKSRDKSTGMKDIEDIANKEEDLSMGLILSDDRRVLLKALESLDEKERILIALKFWSGLKNREIAQLTNLTDQNVGVLVFRSLKKLKSILEEMGVHRLYE